MRPVFLALALTALVPAAYFGVVILRFAKAARTAPAVALEAKNDDERVGEVMGAVVTKVGSIAAINEASKNLALWLLVAVCAYIASVQSEIARPEPLEAIWPWFVAFLGTAAIAGGIVVYFLA